MALTWQHTVHRDGVTCVVTLTGELDMTASAELSQLLTERIHAPLTAAVRADFEAVTFVDSTIINVLITARRSATATGSHFTISGVRGHVHRVLDVTGVLSTLSDQLPP